MPQAAIDKSLRAILSDLGVVVSEIHLERPRDPSHGDLATNLALKVASELGRAPREVAEEIAQRLNPETAGVEAVEVAGPGFLNFRLSTRTVASVLNEIAAEDKDFGRICQSNWPTPPRPRTTGSIGRCHFLPLRVDGLEGSSRVLLQ